MSDFGYIRITDTNANLYPNQPNQSGISPDLDVIVNPVDDPASVVYILNSLEFIEACGRAGVKPSRRQAAKYRNKRGRAYAARLQKLEPALLPEGRAKRTWEEEI